MAVPLAAAAAAAAAAPAAATIVEADGWQVAELVDPSVGTRALAAAAAPLCARHLSVFYRGALATLRTRAVNGLRVLYDREVAVEVRQGEDDEEQV